MKIIFDREEGDNTSLHINAMRFEVGGILAEFLMENRNIILDLNDFTDELNSSNLEKHKELSQKTITNKDIIIQKIKKASYKELANMIFIHQNSAIQCSVCPIGGREKCANFLKRFGLGYCSGCEKTLELWLESTK